MKIIAVGRNYHEHIQELKNETPEEPVLFLKPDTALLKGGRDFYYPDFSNEIHYEVEVVLRICKEGKFVSKKFSQRYFDALTVGIDFTARDIQAKQKEKGLPWEIAKAFDGSAALGELISTDQIEDINNMDFSLTIDGKQVQCDNTSNMIHSFEDLICYISKFFTLKKGDLIFTGTPAGVGPVTKGTKLQGFIESKELLTCSIK